MRLWISWLDVKLAGRMLLKHRAMSVVAAVAIAFAICIGAVFFELLAQALHPRLPLPEGERLVGLRNWDAQRNSAELRSAHDFVEWRGKLAGIESLGAFRSVHQNLVLPGADIGEPVAAAEITAAGLQAAQVAPALGRALLESDERAGAAPVAVISHALWQSRFGADPSVIGRAVRIGEREHVVVGVMPAAFAYPVAHELWLPLTLQTDAYPRRSGPTLRIVGRLAPGASLAQAQAELTALGTRVAAAEPATHATLRPEVLPYAEAMFPLRMDLTLVAGAWSLNLILVMFALLVFANVAMLVFARTAAREVELVMRSALGASRGRLVLQLFVEALALGALAAGIGLLAAGQGVEFVMDALAQEMGDALPFWFRPELSTRTLAYAALLTLLGAAVAGVLPALKVTRVDAQPRLQQAAAGAGGPRFGGVWTAVIVAQVAVTVAFPVSVYVARHEVVQTATQTAGMASEEFLSVRLAMDRHAAGGAPADPARVRWVRAELERRIEAEPGVLGVTYGTQLPRMYHPWRRIELDEGGSRPVEYGPGYRVSGTYVAPDFFETLGAPLLAGRGLREGDTLGADGAVVVNRAFVEAVLGGRNPIGRRLRYVATDEPAGLGAAAAADEAWYRIVGVVPDLAMASGPEPAPTPGLYHPLAPMSSTETDQPGDASVHMAVHVRGDPAAFAPRLHRIATRVDPSLRLYRLQPMDAIPGEAVRSVQYWFNLLLVASAVALLLSLAGIHAVTSFTVVRRTREIGIRLALGASPRSVAMAVFARPLRQIGAGLFAGMLLGGVLLLGVEGGWSNVDSAGMLVFSGYAGVMYAICLLACLLPTRRALRVQPVQALHDDG